MPLYRGFGKGSPPAPPDENRENRTRRIARPGANPATSPTTPVPEAPTPVAEEREVAAKSVPAAVEPTRRIVRTETGKVRRDAVPVAAEVIPATPANHEAIPAEIAPVLTPPVAPAPHRDPLANPVVGWLVITAGPGRGEVLSLSYGVNDIGRGPSARIRLDFGDPAIASDNQAAIIYTARSRRFYLQSVAAGICLNGRTVRDSLELIGGETLQLGQTELRFVPLCGLSFDWRDGS